MNEPVYIGAFGLSWKEKVAEEMLSVLQGTDYESVVKSFWGGSGLNTGLISTLHNVYESILRSGENPPVFNGHIPDSTATSLAQKMEDITQVPYTVTMEFLRSLYTVSSNGTIDFKYYDPVTYDSVKEKTGFNIKDFFDGISGKTNIFLFAAGGVAALYLLSGLKKSTNR